MRRSWTILACLPAVLWAASAYAEAEKEETPEAPKSAQTPGALTFIGRSDGPVVIVERDGTMWEARKRQLTFYNQATPRILDASRRRIEKAAEEMEKAGQIAQERAERRSKAEQAKAEEKKAAGERAAAKKAAAEKKQDREKKILANYNDKEYKYGPNSVADDE